MDEEYDYRNCQSLFGYAYAVHQKSGCVCQLCGSGGTQQSFDWWRQLTVEHIIGRKQGGYLKEIKQLISELLPELDATEQEELARKIHDENTVTACSFCNSTTSRSKTDSMRYLVVSAISENRQPAAIAERIHTELQKILDKKRKDVAWKIISIKKQYEKHFLPSLPNAN